MLDVGRLQVAKGDLIASLFLADVLTAVFGLIYNLSVDSGWPILTTVGLPSFLISDYLLQNQRKNQRKWEKRPVTFPNPEGGGILGLYTERTWYSELAELGSGTRERIPGPKKKSANLFSATMSDTYQRSCEDAIMSRELPSYILYSDRKSIIRTCKDWRLTTGSRPGCGTKPILF